MLHQKFLETAKNFSGKTALQIRQAAGEYRKYTYAQASGLARSVGFYFIEHGIQAQDRIAMILENGPEWPVFYFGILLAGATAVPIDPHLTEQEISNILADSGAKIVINKNTADEILKNLEPLNPDFKFPPIDSDSPASILYTSGTTAVPKGVVLTHRNFLGNLNSVSGLKIYNCRDNVLSILPLHHSYPFMATLVMPLLTGATVTYVPTLKPEEILSAMKETGVTILVGVPQLFCYFPQGPA
ncbi:MAG: AMP-binding protein [Candidatus Omnitrophica bacterium]|nr:AMP-binding protein [Candidatus Omnitrophota bacterium]